MSVNKEKCFLSTKSMQGSAIFYRFSVGYWLELTLTQKLGHIYMGHFVFKPKIARTLSVHFVFLKLVIEKFVLNPEIKVALFEKLNFCFVQVERLEIIKWKLVLLIFNFNNLAKNY